ncbi:unnamed protein product [Rhizoctonia solani]|uniref:Non-specific serine/threonine protein kinase n=1 Tax=Rhizoctonia solani TaxID=456999 RepID=A0A8H3E8C5_9AGAM|nr:unnamed protein product [Rhizoctonia solani]
MEEKMTTPTDLLYRGFPNEFGIFLNYCRALRFDDKPDYSYLRKLFRDLFVRKGYQYDYVFDWSFQRPNADCKSRRKIISWIFKPDNFLMGIGKPGDRVRCALSCSRLRWYVHCLPFYTLNDQVRVRQASRMEYIHSRNYIHCDIEPYKFLVALESAELRCAVLLLAAQLIGPLSSAVASSYLPAHALPYNAGRHRPGLLLPVPDLRQHKNPACPSTTSSLQCPLQVPVAAPLPAPDFLLPTFRVCIRTQP